MKPMSPSLHIAVVSIDSTQTDNMYTYIAYPYHLQDLREPFRHPQQPSPRLQLLFLHGQNPLGKHTAHNLYQQRICLRYSHIAKEKKRRCCERKANDIHHSQLGMSLYTDRLLFDYQVTLGRRPK